MKNEIKIDIQAQPDDETCGPTCLHSLYRYYGVKDASLPETIRQIHRLDSGGTLAEILACHALRRGFEATIYTYHLQMFDPTWFADDGACHDPGDLAARLEEQLRERAAAKADDRRLRVATKACKEFLSLGGRLVMRDLTAALIRRHVQRGVPIIAGLSSTYLYREPREKSGTSEPDDTRGEPQGHFVMIVGYDAEEREVLIADPLDHNPPFHTAKYRLGMSRLVNAVLLGILTYDANLLVIEPGPGMDWPKGAHPEGAEGPGDHPASGPPSGRGTGRGEPKAGDPSRPKAPSRRGGGTSRRRAAPRTWKVR